MNTGKIQCVKCLKKETTYRHMTQAVIYIHIITNKV